MNFTINDVDQVIARTNCSYEEAKEALIEADGVVIDAIIYLQKKDDPTNFFRGFAKDFTEDTQRTVESVAEKIRDAIETGNAERIEVRDSQDKKIFSLSLTAGAVAGTITLLYGGLPFAVISALIAKYGLNCQFVLIRKDGSVSRF
ncbi:MAG: DUF4342 domain-containing protein [Erysipelotrichaceae bacterium]|nr:DUF4342 domain-containing protein [Erysipelotrichaceae bacterium]